VCVLLFFISETVTFCVSLQPLKANSSYSSFSSSSLLFMCHIYMAGVCVPSACSVPVVVAGVTLTLRLPNFSRLRAKAFSIDLELS
jgi:hypothetical protein